VPGVDLASFRSRSSEQPRLDGSSGCVSFPSLERRRVRRWLLLLRTFPVELNRCQPRYKLLLALHIYEGHAFIIASTGCNSRIRTRSALTIGAVFIARSFPLWQPREPPARFQLLFILSQRFRLCRSPFYAARLISSRQAVTSAAVLLQRLQRRTILFAK